MKGRSFFNIAIGAFAVVMMAVLVFSTAEYMLPALFGGKTYELTLPSYEAIDSATLTRQDGAEAELTAAYAQDVLFVLKGNGRSTKFESVQDAPVNVDNWIRVDFSHIGGGSSMLFVFQESEGQKAEYFIEQPYNGIYPISEDEYNSIEKYVKQGGSG